MIRSFAVAAALALLCLGGIAQADVFNLGPGLTNLETVTVGDPGNTADTRYSTPGIGSVGYTYSIGRYEVTAAQYCDFLNHKAQSDFYGLWDVRMGYNEMGCRIQQHGSSGSFSYSVAGDRANRPVNYASYWDACRFTNWLNNGQGDGDSETGAYTLNGYNDMDGREIQRNPGAKWVVTNDDEWYKAAYYRAGGTDAGYWDYPTQNDSTPTNYLTDPDGGNNACFMFNDNWTLFLPYYTTEVGEFENSESAYGTFDQAGNVGEWTETLQDPAYVARVFRGGSFKNTEGYLHASTRLGNSPTITSPYIGFRVVMVPEPSSIIALLGGLAGLLAKTRRRA